MPKRLTMRTLAKREAEFRKELIARHRPSRLVEPVVDPAAPTKMELMQAQRDGEFAGRVTAENMGFGDFDVDEGDLEDRAKTPSMCDLIVERARKDVLRGGYYSSAPPPKFAPLQSAYWTGFDWAVQRKFACVCSPGAALDGLRGRRRRR